MAPMRRAVLVTLRQTLNTMAMPNKRTTTSTRGLMVDALLQSQSCLRSRLGSVSHFSMNLQSFGGIIDLSNEENKRRTINRLLYRSMQRGFLELDLVLGKWVEENIFSMDESELVVLQMSDLSFFSLKENPDLWKWLTNQEQPPEAVNNNPVFSALREKVMGNLENHASPETRATPGQPWVRGWDDGNQ
ncbi:hypothetical protein MKW98_024710 [Papaver atlanticum]|uniref:Succinate dehydrogenase assembly factor 2, mitochondrial n=1 Tax=Papaver atlanticum TaxID=357466 RepID=A0AAD4X7R9_9MAGN|nr:hypothetical protein MKW98_024710 [Papaver atlanticum]